MSDQEQEGPEYEATARLGRSLKGRMARRAIEERQGQLDEVPYTIGELLAMENLELRMQNRREVDELNRLVLDEG